jgi:hypothetical protein
MSCCAQQRRPGFWTAKPDPGPGPGYVRANARTGAAPVSFDFEYRGLTSLTVVGGATGHAYRFERPGTRIAVAARDAPGLMAIPNLHRSDPG